MGKVVVRYAYDAWGKHTVEDISGIGLGNLNPFRYRGYYYDVATGLYYLNTRYYDPETGRFISPDGIEYLDPDTINGLNFTHIAGIIRFPMWIRMETLGGIGWLAHW